MCTYGIGLPFDHPIWKSLPPCRCGQDSAWSLPEKIDFGPFTDLPLPDFVPDVPDVPVIPIISPVAEHYCPMCGMRHAPAPPPVITTTTTSWPSETTTPYVDTGDDLSVASVSSSKMVEVREVLYDQIELWASM